MQRYYCNGGNGSLLEGGSRPQCIVRGLWQASFVRLSKWRGGAGGGPVYRFMDRRPGGGVAVRCQTKVYLNSASKKKSPALLINFVFPLGTFVGDISSDVNRWRRGAGAGHRPSRHLCVPLLQVLMIGCRPQKPGAAVCVCWSPVSLKSRAPVRQPPERPLHTCHRNTTGKAGDRALPVCWQCG